MSFTRPRILIRGLTVVALTTASVTLAGGIATPAQALWDSVSRTCQVQDSRIKENSGMSRSTYARDGYFVHNDSGGGPQFFFIGANCATQALIQVPGAPSKDWEDMDSGPNHTLWFGDIGGKRSEINVVRVVEPASLSNTSVSHTTYRFTYPDGQHNAEAMMVHPTTGRVYIIAKASRGAGIYAGPTGGLSASGTNRLTRIGNAPGQGLSRADYAMDGSRFVLGGYRTLFVYSGWGTTPTKVQVPDGHSFGEAMTFDRAGAMVLGAEGVRQWLWRIR